MAGGLQVLGRTYRHLNRYREVAAVLVKHGLGDVLHMVRLDRYLEAGLKSVLHRHTVFDPRTRAARVRMALEELGPAFIKTGQYLSTRADLIPDDYRRELAKLQDEVPPFPAEEARRIVEEELGAPVSRLFKRFGARPIAAASIAQIHEAELHDGEPVVLKISRPGLRDVVAVDLEIMAHLAALAEQHLEDWSWRRPTKVVAEIARSLDHEMDFSLEAAHVERFARQFSGDGTLYAPRVIRRLSTDRVLTLERVDGVKIDDLGGLDAAGLDSREVAQRLCRHYLAMVFVHGFFHADPHPGNLLVLPGHVIGYLDFGMMGRLDRATRESLADVVLAIVERDEAALGRSLLTLAIYDDEPDPRAFEADVGELMDEYAYRPVAEWRLGRVLEQVFRMTTSHRVRVPPELFLMVKTVTELESLAFRLDPSFDAAQAAAPFIRWVHTERMKPRRVAHDLVTAGRDAMRLLSTAPADLRELFRQARRGRLMIEFEHKGLEPALSVLEHVSNRLAYSVLLAALLIGSSLVVHAGIPPYWEGVSVFGLAGYVVSALMSLNLLLAIARHGRL